MKGAAISSLLLQGGGRFGWDRKGGSRGSLYGWVGSGSDPSPLVPRWAIPAKVVRLVVCTPEALPFFPG